MGRPAGLTIVKTCRECSDTFVGTPPRQYCDTCTPEVKRRQGRANAKKYSARAYGDPLKLCHRLVLNAKARASLLDREFDIDTDYMIQIWEQQEGVCALSGVKFSMVKGTKNKKNPNVATIDRIDASKGYIKGNVRLVTYQVNTALNQWGTKQFLKMCKNVMNELGDL